MAQIERSLLLALAAAALFLYFTRSGATSSVSISNSAIKQSDLTTPKSNTQGSRKNERSSQVKQQDTHLQQQQQTAVLLPRSSGPKLSYF
jgi:hypothetical protein